MKNSEVIGLSCLFAAVLTLLAPQPASAITAELAKQCRAMSMKAYPPARVGTKTGNAKSGLVYYRACIANNGTMPDTPAAAAPPPK